MPETSGKGAQRTRGGDGRRATGRKGGWRRFERTHSEFRDNPQAQILQQGKLIALNELWDEEKMHLVKGDDMASIKGARRKLEHTEYVKAHAAQEP